MMKKGEFNPSIQHQRSNSCFKMAQVGSDGIWNGSDPLKASLPLFMLQITIMIVTTRVIQLILRPIKQPRVVAEIIAGIIIGPSVLGRSETWANVIFPPQGENLIRTCALLGMVFFLFLSGVKTDPTLIVRSGRKALAIAVMGCFVPLVAVTAAAFTRMKHIKADIAHGPFLIFFPASISVTAFPNLAPMLKELDLLNSELGQLALSTALINDCFGYFFMGLFTALDQSQDKPILALWSMLALGGVISCIIHVFKPWTNWIIKKVPRGGHVEEGYLVLILLGCMISAFLTDFAGATIAVGPLFLGLAVRDGPPLGSALIDRAELVVMELFAPLLFVMAGMSVDLTVLLELKKWTSLFMVMFIGYIGKLVGTMVTGMYCDMYIGSSFVLGLIMSFRGTVEVMTFLNWWTGGLLDEKSFTVAVLCTLIVTAIARPLVAIFYDPFTRNSASSLGGRTVQHTRPNSELRVLTCVHGQEPVPSIIHLLKGLNATDTSPMCVYVLHMVELVGRAAPLLIPHKSNHDLADPVLNAFVNYETRMDGCVVVQPFTTVSPYKTMHQDICKLAEDKAVALLVVPFRRKESAETLLSKADQAVRAMIPVLLENSPCSVGILVHDGGVVGPEAGPHGRRLQRIGVVFWGGPDDREALFIASRMAGREGAVVSILRYVYMETAEDDRERRLDEECLDEFKSRNLNSVNNDGGLGMAKVVVKEMIVHDTAETIESIRLMGTTYDLLVVGRQPQTLATGLSEWSECPELGVIGDLFASLDNDRPCSVLVVQQRS